MTDFSNLTGFSLDDWTDGGFNSPALMSWVIDICFWIVQGCCDQSKLRGLSSS